MKKHLGTILGILLAVSGCYAQTTTVAATVTDSDSQAWANGTWTIKFQPGPSDSNIGHYTNNGAALSSAVTNQSGTLNGSGVLSVVVYDNGLTSPSGSQWLLNVCPKASAPCGSYLFAAAGTSTNISTALNAVIKAPRFGSILGAYGYRDSEATATTPGSTYYDVTLGCPKVYSGSAWACFTAAGGPPTGAAGGDLAGTYPNPTLAVPHALVKIAQTVVSGSSTTAITFSAIPQTYSQLKFVGYGRCSNNAPNSQVLLTLNGDTGSNYDTLYMIGSGASTIGAYGSNGTAGANILITSFMGATAAANQAGSFDLLIPNYANALFYKTVQYQSVTVGDTTLGHLAGLAGSGQWRSAAAVTSVTFTAPSSGVFIAGSVITLYGIL